MQRNSSVRFALLLAILPAVGINCVPNIGGPIADILDYFVSFRPGDAIVRTPP